MELIEAIRALPKIEQHVQLLGSIRPVTLMKAITDTGAKTPYASLEEIEQAFEFQDFAHFLSVYGSTMNLIVDE